MQFFLFLQGEIALMGLSQRFMKALVSQPGRVFLKINKYMKKNPLLVIGGRSLQEKKGGRGGGGQGRVCVCVCE